MPDVIEKKWRHHDDLAVILYDAAPWLKSLKVTEHCLISLVCQVPKGVRKPNQNVSEAGMFSFKEKTDRQGSGDTYESRQQIKVNYFSVQMQKLGSLY